MGRFRIRSKLFCILFGNIKSAYYLYPCQLKIILNKMKNINSKQYGSKIMFLAWGILKKGEAPNLSTAMKAAWAAVRVQAAMSEGVATFTFIKADGSTRPARGTRSLSLIPASFHPKGESEPRATNVVKFFDLEAQEWRSFRAVALVA